MARWVLCRNCSSWHNPLLGVCPPEDRRVYTAPAGYKNPPGFVPPPKPEKGAQKAPARPVKAKEPPSVPAAQERPQAPSNGVHHPEPGLVDRVAMLEAAVGILDEKLDTLSEKLEKTTVALDALEEHREKMRKRQKRFRENHR